MVECERSAHDMKWYVYGMVVWCGSVGGGIISMFPILDFRFWISIQFLMDESNTIEDRYEDVMTNVRLD